MKIQPLPFLFLILSGVSLLGLSPGCDSPGYSPLHPAVVDWEFGAAGAGGMGGAGGSAGVNPKSPFSLGRFEDARDGFIAFLDDCGTFGAQRYSHTRYPSLPYYSVLFECLVKTEDCPNKQEFLCADYPESWEDCFTAFDTFSCQNDDEIPAQYQCDTIPDCESAEDELNCQDLWFRCDDGSAVLATQRCDDRIQCADGSDEDNCNIPRFSCDFQKAVPEWEVCNITNDCADESDEGGDCVEVSCN